MKAITLLASALFVMTLMVLGFVVSEAFLYPLYPGLVPAWEYQKLSGHGHGLAPMTPIIMFGLNTLIYWGLMVLVQTIWGRQSRPISKDC